MGNEIKFKPATFYLGVADHLAKAVEGLEPEEVDAGRSRDKRGTKRGSEEIPGGVSQGIAQVEPKQAPVFEDNVTTEVHPTDVPAPKQPSTKGQGESADPAPNSGLNHHEVTTSISLSTILEVTTSTLSTQRPGSHTYPPQQHTPESKLKDPHPIPARQTTNPHSDE